MADGGHFLLNSETLRTENEEHRELWVQIGIGHVRIGLRLWTME